MINHDLLKSNNSTRFKIDRKEAEKYIYERDRERMHIALYLQWKKKIQEKNICNGKKLFQVKNLCVAREMVKSMAVEAQVNIKGTILPEKYGCRSSSKK